MSPFDKLDPHIRSVALVGQFLQAWALMEFSINDAIAKALDLDAVQGAIVCGNMQFRDKINVLRTAVSLASITPAEKRATYDKTLIEIQEYSPTRNMMAHDMFFADEETDGVRFSVTKAKGKLNFPKIVWAMADFKSAYSKLGVFGAQIDRLKDDLITASLINAMLKTRLPEMFSTGTDDPSDMRLGRGILGLPVPPPPIDPSSDTNPAIPETDDETPPSPQE